jgi:hypothetical protein
MILSNTALRSKGTKRASLDAPERQFVDFGALGTIFDLGWDYALGVVALTANRERHAWLRIKNSDYFPRKTAKKLVIGLMPVCRQSSQFFEFGLWYLKNDVKADIWLT